MKQKLMRLKGISSSSENKEDSKDSVNQRFEEDHKIKDMMDPLENRNKIVITVMDTGIGIKKKEKLKLFKLFGTL